MSIALGRPPFFIQGWTSISSFFCSSVKRGWFFCSSLSFSLSSLSTLWMSLQGQANTQTPPHSMHYPQVIMYMTQQNKAWVSGLVGRMMKSWHWRLNTYGNTQAFDRLTTVSAEHWAPSICTLGKVRGHLVVNNGNCNYVAHKMYREKTFWCLCGVA